MKHIKVEDAIEIILASDHKTTKFLTVAGVGIVQNTDGLDFTPFNDQLTIKTSFPKALSLVSNRQVININKVSSYDLDTLQYSTNKAIDTKKEQYQKRLLLSINHCKDNDTSNPICQVNYYIRQSKILGYFLESRIVQFRENEIMCEVPIYSKIPDRYQSLIEDVRVGKTY